MSLILLLGGYTPPSAPAITILTPTDVTQHTATVNASIGSGGLTITRRGVQYSTTPYVDREVDESGITWAGGAYDVDLVNLNAGQAYYYRFYATNSLGTTTTAWATLTTPATAYSITINGVDRTADILANSLSVEDIINDQSSICQLSLMDINEVGLPETDDEIIITLDDGTKLFGGYITNINITSKKQTGRPIFQITCVDYSRILDSNLVRRTYENMTDKEIIDDIVTRYCVGTGITTTHVVEGVTLEQISFNYVQPSQCFRKIAELAGRNWYIDYDKDIHYFPMVTDVAPYHIDSAENRYYNLNISKDATQIKNRVYVRGGTKLSDYTTYSTKGDGVKRQFVLPDKPHDVTLTVNGVSKTLGVKNLNTSGFDYYLNYQEKYVEQDSLASVLASTDTLAITYKYDIPILVAVEDTQSIIDNGVKEFAIFDKTIATTQSARDRATAELTDYANNLIEGSFMTYTNGFKSGQYININLDDYGVNADYVIQKVKAVSYGNNNYRYEVSIASAKTLGIIKFLVQLLEANKNLIELNDDEIVDELLTTTDALLNDSLLDSLTIDSAGLNATWCTDSLDSLPSTRARWGLFQWGA